MIFSTLLTLRIQDKPSNISHQQFLDSGASYHMTDSLEYLYNLKSYHGNKKIQIVHTNTLSITKLMI